MGVYSGYIVDYLFCWFLSPPPLDFALPTLIEKVFTLQRQKKLCNGHHIILDSLRFC